MSFTANDSSRILAPAADSSAPRAEQRLANTGTTESSNSTALSVGCMATLCVGATAIRVTFRTSTGLSTQVAATNRIIPAYGSYDWYVTNDTKVVYIEAADSASAYEAHVWTSS